MTMGYYYAAWGVASLHAAMSHTISKIHKAVPKVLHGTELNLLASYQGIPWKTILSFSSA